MKKKKTLLAVLLAVGVSLCSSTGIVASAGNMETQDLILQEEQGMEYVGASSSKKPAKTTITSIDAKSYDALTLHWKKVKGAKGYEIYRKSKEERSYRKVKTIKKGTILRYTDSHLDSRTKYTYKIRCYSVSKGKKVYSNFSHSKCRTTKSVPLYTGSYSTYKDGGRTSLYATISISNENYYAELGRNHTFATTRYSLEKSKVGYHGYSENGDEIDIIPYSWREIKISVTGNTGGFWEGYYTKR